MSIYLTYNTHIIHIIHITYICLSIHTAPLTSVPEEIMMTIKLFGATIPVPKNTLVFPPLRDLYDSSPDV